MQDEFHSFTKVRILDLQVTGKVFLVVSHKQTKYLKHTGCALFKQTLTKGKTINTFQLTKDID